MNVLEMLYAAIYLISVGLSGFSLTRLYRFLTDTTSIADQVSLQRFKELAREQMYLALGMLALLGVGILVGIALIARHGMAGFVAVILTNLAVLGLGMYHKKIEVRARSLPAASDALAAEYRRVSEIWVKKALPDF